LENNWQWRELAKAEDEDEEKKKVEGEEVVWMLDGVGGCVALTLFIAEQVRCQMIVYCQSSTDAINQESDLHWERRHHSGRCLLRFL
jgi:hypothetical protein